MHAESPKQGSKRFNSQGRRNSLPIWVHNLSMNYIYKYIYVVLSKSNATSSIKNTFFRVRPATHWLRGVSMSAAWRVRLYFGSHGNRLERAHCLRNTHVSGAARAENVCMLEIDPTAIFHATRKRVGSISRQNRIRKDDI